MKERRRRRRRRAVIHHRKTRSERPSAFTSPHLRQCLLSSQEPL